MEDEDKIKYRRKTNDTILYLVICMAIAAVILAFMGILTSEFNMALAAILGYAGNYTYQNYRTSPTTINKEIIKPK